MTKRKLWRPNREDDYVSAILGLPPTDFDAAITRAAKIAELAGNEFGEETCLIDELLIATIAHVRMADHPRAYPVNRIRQISEWINQREDKSKVTSRKPDSPEALASKLREISNVVMQMLYKTESFLLLITDHRLDSVYHSSSINRRDQIGLLRQHLAQLESEQAEQS